MPARGDGLAILKWVTSFPGNSDRGLPVVRGAVVALRRGDGRGAGGRRVRLGDLAADRGARRRSRRRCWRGEDATSVGLIGCGVNGAWAARCLAAAGFGPGVCRDPRARDGRGAGRGARLEAGTREEAAAQDVVVTVTPGEKPVIGDADLRDGPAPGGARGRRARQGGGRARSAGPHAASSATSGSRRARAGSSPPPSTRAACAARRDPDRRRATGACRGPPLDVEITLFDSTGLAIQDLAIVSAV